MMDLIEREPLFAALCSKCSGHYLRNVSIEECREEICATKDTIMAAPAVDALPVVRCKDCKHWLKDVAGCTENVGRCEWANWMVGDNGYCVYGERKEVQEVRDEDG